MTPPTREQVEVLLALEAKATPGDWRSIGAHICNSSLGSLAVASDVFYKDRPFIIAARNLIRPLAEAYLAGLDATDRAWVEELEGVREWAFEFFVEGEQKYMDGVSDTIELIRDELDRRIAAIRERKP